MEATKRVFTLACGVAKEVQVPCYSVNRYNCGKWERIALYPYTEEGKIEAEYLMHSLEGKDIEVEVCF